MINPSAPGARKSAVCAGDQLLIKPMVSHNQSNHCSYQQTAGLSGDVCSPAGILVRQHWAAWLYTALCWLLAWAQCCKTLHVLYASLPCTHTPVRHSAGEGPVHAVLGGAHWWASGQGKQQERGGAAVSFSVRTVLQWANMVFAALFPLLADMIHLQVAYAAFISG
jgi:hypothetical protein